MQFPFCYLVVSRVSLRHSFICSFIYSTQRAARRQAAMGDSDWDILGPPEGGTPPRGLVSPGADPLFSVPLQGSSQALASCFVSHIT